MTKEIEENFKDWDEMPDLKGIIEDRGYSLQKVLFKDAGGNDCYACVLMRKADVEKFQKSYASGAINLTDFGQILASGFGSEIPEIEKAILDEMTGKPGTWN